MFAPDAAGAILGIDPGLSRCGYGAIVPKAGKGRAVAGGVIRTSPKAPLPRRLAQVAEELEALIEELEPSAIAVERVLFQVNVSTAMSVGQVCGLVLVAAERAGVPIVMYSPNEVKLAVTGDGRADKAAIQSMVVRLLGLAEVPKPPDVADALALALTHASVGRLRDAYSDADALATEVIDRSEHHDSPELAAALARIEGALPADVVTRVNAAAPRRDEGVARVNRLDAAIAAARAKEDQAKVRP